VRSKAYEIRNGASKYLFEDWPAKLMMTAAQHSQMTLQGLVGLFDYYYYLQSM
jgi:hypothetical protein